MMAGRRPASGDSGASGAQRHIPVLLHEVVEAMAPANGDRLLDGTFGAGGYSKALLDAAPEARLLAIERDPQARAAGASLVAVANGRLTLIEGRFGELGQIALAQGFAPLNGVVLDIGVSSMQIDQPERGFSFMNDGPLDMRMEARGPSAADLVNTAPEDVLADIIYGLGEERQSRRIARAIGRARETTPLKTTGELARLLERTLGRRPDEDRHPATRTFQALRMAVNDELGELARGLVAAESVLAAGGRLVVVTFHSLEDRVVKRFLARRAGRHSAGSRHAPPDIRTTIEPSFTLVNHRPVTPTKSEISRNPRARSAKMRVALRTGADSWETETLAELGVPSVPDWT